jgi:phosphodiesterase/alkaline phosphatase D-like protein
VPGSSNLFTIGARYDGHTGLLDLRLLNYADTLASQAGNMVPASGAKGVGTISGGLVNVPLSWGGISGTEYKWQVAIDSTFDTIVKEGTASTASATATGLQTGTTYYWRVKATQPSAGPWSATVSFTTASTVSGAPTLISPANSAIVTGAPIFTWSTVTGATSYKIQVATDSGFTSITKETTATTNVYASDKLSNNVYFWRVQATVGSDTTAWSATGAFTVGAATTSSSTPAWVWVLIVLGIVLAIFVLVLILRTRRPV